MSRPDQDAVDRMLVRTSDASVRADADVEAAKARDFDVTGLEPAADHDVGTDEAAVEKHGDSSKRCWRVAHGRCRKVIQRSILSSMSTNKRQNTSLKRQTTVAQWRVLAKHHLRGAVLPEHQHQTGQLVYALSGTMLVETRWSRWTIPPQRALWIPPQHPHSIRMLSHTELRTVYVQPALLALCQRFERQASVHAIVVSPLIRELVLGLFPDRADMEMQSLMVRLLLFALHEGVTLSTDLPLPSDAGLHRAVSRLLASPSTQFSLADVADMAAMSERTFTRRFTADVGVSFRVWRQRARIIASLDLLAAQRSIKFVARAMGFSSTAAYATAFRNLLDRTPTEFRGNGAGH